MKKIAGAIMILMLGTVLYLMLNIIGVPVPLPKWYEKQIKEHADSIIAHDNFLNLAKTTVKIRDERDSLQHIVDSLKK